MTSELACTSHPCRCQLPHGTFATSCDNNGDVYIDHADPRVLISGELIIAIAANPTAVARIDRTTATSPAAVWSFIGATLKIAAENRTVIYRITDYVPYHHGYIGEWPD